MTATLERATFETSRALEYFSEKELRQQIGYDKDYWPLVIIRELIDNSLDACEVGTKTPEIGITVADDEITVTDNGPGITPETVEKSLDYSVRVSDKAYYVSPTRGQMGNALKVIWAASFVDSGSGFVEITARGVRHRVTIDVDRIAQKPALAHERLLALVKNGTSSYIRWPGSTSLLLAPPVGVSYKPAPQSVGELVGAFAAFNPHTTFTLNGERFERTVPGWEKWRTDDPTSAHWYSCETLRDLVAAYVAKERDGGRVKTVREFVSEFRGLSGTAKQKAVGWAGQYLHDFVTGGDIDAAFIEALLERMKAQCKAPKPSVLGIVGEDHLKSWMVANGVAESTIMYKRRLGADTLPYVLEVAFGINDDEASSRRIAVGLNWSPVIGGATDEVLRSAIASVRIDPHDPVTLVVHAAKARFNFADRGKTRVA